MTNEATGKNNSMDRLFDDVEEMPSFPGGAAALMQYFASNISYPVVAKELGIQGSMVVQFIVGKDGSISQAKVVKSVDPSLDNEAVRVVSSMLKWVPGMQNGQAVNVKYTIPVPFKLDE